LIAQAVELSTKTVEVNQSRDFASSACTDCRWQVQGPVS